MTIPHQTGNHEDHQGDHHRGPGDHHGGAHPHPGPAALGLDVANGTIRSISGTTFVLATEQLELTVATSADTNFHGLSRRQAREVGYQDAEVAVINTFAGLRVGQPVGVMGERQDGSTLLAKRVHMATP